MSTNLSSTGLVWLVATLAVACEMPLSHELPRITPAKDTDADGADVADDDESDPDGDASESEADPGDSDPGDADESDLDGDTSEPEADPSDSDPGDADVECADLPSPSLGAAQSQVGTDGVTIAVTWTVDADPDAFELQRQDGTVWTTLTTITDGAARAFEDVAQLRDHTYAYRIRTEIDGCFSSWSQPASVTTSPNDPVLTVVESVSGVELSWTDANGLETGYHVYRRVGAGQPFSLIAWNLPPDTVFYVDWDSAPNTSYEYQLSVVHPGGTRAVTAALLTLPLAPYDFGVVTVDVFGVNLRWEDMTTENTGGCCDLQLSRRRLDDNATATIVLDPDPGHTEWFDPGLEPATTYIYTLAAINAAGAASRELNATTLAWPAGLDSLTNTSVTLAWQPTGQPTEILRSLVESGVGVYDVIATLDANTTSYVDEALASTKHRRYRILSNSIQQHELEVWLAPAPLDLDTEVVGSTLTVSWLPEAEVYYYQVGIKQQVETVFRTQKTARDDPVVTMMVEGNATYDVVVTAFMEWGWATTASTSVLTAP